MGAARLFGGELGTAYLGTQGDVWDAQKDMALAGFGPHTPLDRWTFSIENGGMLRTWTWEEFRALPSEPVTADIHCVTRWSKLATTWEGVSVDTLLDEVDHDASHVLAFCDGGYTTNLPLEDVTGGKAWIVYTYEGEHQGPTVRSDGRTLMEALDGNAIGGMLNHVFGREMTMAQTECGRCAARGPLAECEVYLAGPGVVVRCRVCHNIVMVLVEVREMMCVNLGGLSELELPAWC